jgi:GntR family transcriptional repressor for pyruvate dehydrogenase complex
MQNNEKRILSPNPVDSIIEQLKHRLNTGQLNPGDRIPAERKLAEDFGVSRAYIRTAIKKLEYYGIFKTIPQSGTFVAGLDTSALAGLIQDALQVESYDLYSLAESRLILETNIIRLSCQRRTEEDLTKIEYYVTQYEEKIMTGIPAVEEDLRFHRQIAEASKNQVLKSMMLIITPDLMTNYRKFWSVEDSPKRSVAAMEHRLLLEYIRNREEEAAAKMIAHHLRGIMEYARTHSISMTKFTK